MDWKRLNKQDTNLIHECAKRALKVIPNIVPDVDLFSVTMDISAAHILAPIRLEQLLNADDGNFAHDVFGIITNINRDTGKMDNCFSPRFSEL